MLSGWLDRHAPDGDLGDPGQVAAGVITVAELAVPEVEAFCAGWDMTVRRSRARRRPLGGARRAGPPAARARLHRDHGDVPALRRRYGEGGRRARARRPPLAAQKMRTATSAGASNSALSSSSSLTSVIEAPAMSSEVQYSPT